MNKATASLVLICFVLLTACGQDKHSPRGFSLPEGNVEAGKLTFSELQCNACHYTPDIEQLVTEEPSGISVELGGQLGHVKTYADLLTSIINPSHRLPINYPADMVAVEGESRMRNYNDVMTVEQLVNLVTYLQPHYKLMVPDRTAYRRYRH
jgi:hypothetical protein